MEHKLHAIIESDRTRTVYCQICGQVEPTGSCIGYYEMTKEQEKTLDDDMKISYK